MGFIEYLSRFGDKVDVNKTELYHQIMSHESQLKAMGLNLKIKKDLDLFEYEIIYNGLQTQNKIENTYEMFLNEHYDLLDYLNYDEKQKMFNSDIQEILDNAPHFIDETSQVDIYIPYLEPFVNQRYTHDYQILQLKQHRDYIKNYKVNHDSPSKMYGLSIYHTNFTSLKNVYEDDRHIDLYYEPLKALYIFKKDTKKLLNKVILVDEKCSHTTIDIQNVQLIAKYLEEYLYRECLDLMYENHMICEKTYHKIQKKYK
ncbi:MAG: hypothetical protein LUG60_08565 [Erysipelotrichaceae bacterium]|nr:hypothetical protein [Erysipelotrichaceae bacterium]